ncbi:hypothetical protein B0T21DRAFT_297413 [Apiosordaria backusii]|uniref:HNH nuclease domain-containing protein n=1 Tax=Apiosordaria backusii TaxID=314023 RepID=A0AA40AAJ2_9PEZI|nr:hypothetical protein B0T21DRAFT_297413 [Apiosordaria backusii]
MAALPPFTPPAITHDPGIASREICFRHPAYPSSAPDLLVLTAADSDGGLDFDVALVSCCIVADVRWDDGYLAQKDVAGGSSNQSFRRIDRPPDGTLRGREFFFCIAGREPSSFKYPVIPSFHHWRFPHSGFDEAGEARGDLPPPWRSLRLPELAPPRPTVMGPAAALSRDITCRVSGYMDAVENAHLVPVGERLWFISNGMKRQETAPFASVFWPNILILRKDIHHLFDARRFTFLPKRFGTRTAESAELVTHVLRPTGSPELVGLYHNRSPQPIRGVSVECLFARFAWSLFTEKHLPFFESGLEYAVRLWDEAKGEAETKTLRGLDVGLWARIFERAQSQSRSASPTKRSISTQGDGQDDGDGEGYWSDDQDIIVGDELECDGWDEPPRGRPRKRGWESLGLDVDRRVPSLSSSFMSAQSSLASRAGLPSRPLTPEGRGPTASREAAGEAGGSLRPQKRVRVEEEPAVGSWVDGSDHV